MRIKILLMSFVAILIFLITSCDTSQPKICYGEPASEDAYYKTQVIGSDEAIMVNGRRITPYHEDGAVLTQGIGVYPTGAAISPNGKIIAVSNNGIGDFFFFRDKVPGVDPQKAGYYFQNKYQSITFVDMAQKKVIYKLPVESLFIGIVFSPDGKYLYAAGGGRDVVRVIKILSYPGNKTGFAVEVTNPISVPYYPTGLAISKDGKRLYVTQLQHHNLSIVNVDHSSSQYGKIVTTYTTQSYPYAITLTSDEKYAFVTNWGGNSVTVIDLIKGEVITNIPVGKNPEGMAIYNGRLFVANSLDDTISVINISTLQLEKQISLLSSPQDRIGITPVDIKVDPTRGYLYVVCAGDNKVDVLDLNSYEKIGSIPAGYYPSEIVLTKDGSFAAVVNSKGKIRKDAFTDLFTEEEVREITTATTGTNYSFNGKNCEVLYGTMLVCNNMGFVNVAYIIQGMVNIFSVPDRNKLKELAEIVKENNDMTRRFYKTDNCDVWENPIPKKAGGYSPIKHVVYIVRENKTYDVDLGDLNTGDGAPELALFGEKVTPNLHALAREFTNFDNFYSEPEQSLQGHIWIAGGWSTDFDEKNWMAMWGRQKEHQVFLPVMQPVTKPHFGSLFEYLKSKGVYFRIYGEVTGVLDQVSKELYDNFDWKYPSWSLHIKDTDKAKEFIRELQDGIFPSFVYIWLPDDHTYGATPGKPDPVWMISNNDEATGMIVEAISHSSFWESTLIFIFEDDPQSSPDHVDAHRSLLLAVSPYVKHNYVSHVHYSIPSIHHTTELILGIPPMSRYDQLAAPMYDAFTMNANLTPYNHLPSQIPFSLVPEDAPGSEESKKLNFDLPDQAPGLGRILWEYVKGSEDASPPIGKIDDDDDK